MNYDEQALQFRCGGESLVGIVAIPEQPQSTGIVLVVGGPQYRAGSHRQFTVLSRVLADAGFPVLRFDVRGMGDSSGASRDFLDIDDDIDAAIAALQERIPAMRRVVLWGLCDAAAAALLYCGNNQDPRVRGLCLINPWVRSPASEARTMVKHYYLQRLTEPDFWSKVVRGRVGGSALKDLAQTIRRAAGDDPTSSPQSAEASFQQQMAAAWRSFEGPILLVLSGRDYTAKEFIDRVESDAAWSGAFGHARLTRHDVAEADHTFSEASARSSLERHTLKWLQGEPS